MRKPFFKTFSFTVNAAEERVVKTFELDKCVTAIKGLSLESNRDDLLYYRGTQGIEINKEEIFPEGYSSRRLMVGINIEPNKRFHELEGVKPGNGEIKIEFTDVPDGVTSFDPYIVYLYVNCEREADEC